MRPNCSGADDREARCSVAVRYRALHNSYCLFECFWFELSCSSVSRTSLRRARSPLSDVLTQRTKVITYGVKDV